MILDTNALSAFADKDQDAIARIREASILAIPVVALGEFRFGVSQSRMSGEYERWLTEFLPSCRVLDVTSQTTVSYAQIRLELKRQGKPIPSNDVWIAAMCRQHSLPVLSRDRHFDWVRDVQRISW